MDVLILRISFILIGIFVVSTTGTVTIEVELMSYNNPTSEDCDGGNCEGLLGTCDNQFDFCVRETGSSSCLITISSAEIEDDDSLSFTPSELNELSLSNPLRFNNVATANPLEIFVSITDIDIGGNDPVDMITVEIPRNTRANGQLSPFRTYSGQCGRASIALRFSIISNCPVNTYGPQCNRQCNETGGRRLCNYLGEPTCLGNFIGPTCTTCKTGFQGSTCTSCAPNYYPPGGCFCTPKNDSLGHYTCDIRTGDRICLEGYSGPETNCITPTGSSSSTPGDEEGFVGSTVFIVIIAVVVAVPLISFIIVLFILCVLCLLSSDVDCSCPKIDCDDCCGSFFKSLSCGLKCDDFNPFVICAFVVLGILAAPFVIAFGVVALVVFLVAACIFYSITGICD